MKFEFQVKTMPPPTQFFFFFKCKYVSNGAFLIAQLVENLPAMLETLVRFLGWEGTLEKG